MSQQIQASDTQGRHGEHANDEVHANEMNEPVPHVGQPLDGRHYLDVLEEQAHADAKPDLDGENPRHPDKAEDDHQSKGSQK
ncbi:MAG: hypothetical protein ACO1NO_08005 [Burkholderiaceae bacterium]